MVDFLEPEGKDVLEIGPGGGILTKELLRTGARVLGWELDIPWAFELRHRLAGLAARLEAHRGLPARVVIGDALDIPWERLPSPILVVGNLPYNVGTVLIRNILGNPGGKSAIPKAAFLVQLEVGQRLVARPGDKQYGASSVLTAACAKARLLGRLRPGCFRPPPKVTSAFIGFELRARDLPDEEYPLFVACVHTAFSKRRKTLLNSLGSSWGRQEATMVLEEAGVEMGKRAQELELSEFLAIHRARISISGQSCGDPSRASVRIRRD